MNAKEKRAREIMRDIQRVLLRDWDPIGVSDEPHCQDEYDGYAGGVYRLLASGADAETIAKHLVRIETKWMGISEIPFERLVPVARKLLSLIFVSTPNRRTQVKPEMFTNET